MVVRTMYCTSHITRAMIRVAKGGENHSATKKCAWYAYYCLPLGFLQGSQCYFVAAAAAEQSVLYDTMAIIIIVRTIFDDTLYLVHSKRMT